jgi:hypothetical protein
MWDAAAPALMMMRAPRIEILSRLSWYIARMTVLIEFCALH